MGTHICTICGKPAFPHEGIYSITQNHWDCEAPRIKDPLEEFKKAEAKLHALLGTVAKQERKKDGTGRTAQKLIVRLTRALKREGLEPIQPIVLWNQAPSYRGPRWDLASWGTYVDCRIIDGENSNPVKVVIASWYTMSAAVKLAREHRGLTLVRDGGPYHYDITGRKPKKEAS